MSRHDMTFGLPGENFRSARCARSESMILDSKSGKDLENAAEIAKNDVNTARIARIFFGLDS